MQQYDLVICGAGPVGCVIANRAAHLLNWKVLLVEKRHHIAGNCYDEYREGVLIHTYGPHYFRTNNQKLLDFLSLYTEWIPGNYIVKSSTNAKLFPFPINLDTLELFFGKKFDAESAERFLAEKAEKIAEPKNSEEFVLSRVGRELYEAFYRGYTKKQWGCEPRELDPSVCGRIPVRFNRDERYVDHQFQLTPKEGFTALFQKMISHPLITVQLNTDYLELRKAVKPTKATVYSGPIDSYFDFKFGKLPWRSLEFEFKEYQQEYLQPNVQINYPNEFNYTRSVEIKHVTGQKTKNTVVSYEYPRAEGDPYYPVPAPANTALYKKYQELAREEEQKNRVYFIGRLANYCYYNTDQVIEEALKCFDRIASRA